MKPTPKGRGTAYTPPPHYFTDIEGSYLIPWGKHRWDPDILKLRNTSPVELDQRPIHSLFWCDKKPKHIWDVDKNYFRWDCINGWTHRNGKNVVNSWKGK